MEKTILVNETDLYKRYITDAEGSLWDRQDNYRERSALAHLLQFAGKVITFEVRKHKKSRKEIGVVLRIESVGELKAQSDQAHYEGRFLVQTKKGLTLVERRLLKFAHGDIAHFKGRRPRGFPYDNFFFNTCFDIDYSNHDGLLSIF